MNRRVEVSYAPNQAAEPPVSRRRVPVWPSHNPLIPCRRNVSDINAIGPIGGASGGVWRRIEDDENGLDCVTDDGLGVDVVVVVVPGVVVVPRAPSRVNIWTCILHLINSIGVLLVSNSSIVRKDKGSRSRVCGGIGSSQKQWRIEVKYVQDKRSNSSSPRTSNHQFPNPQPTSFPRTEMGNGLLTFPIDHEQRSILCSCSYYRCWYTLFISSFSSVRDAHPFLNPIPYSWWLRWICTHPV